jgi:hypothetical protein
VATLDFQGTEPRLHRLSDRVEFGDSCLVNSRFIEMGNNVDSSQ